MKDVIIIVFIAGFFFLLVRWNGWLRGLYQAGLILVISLLAAQKYILGFKGEFVALAVTILAIILHFIWSSMRKGKTKTGNRK